ncbi:MAG TPA: 2-amino-4-hydroxy-6-hydroxymethyldihydropteridine diphosphokinase [Burkholderiaceae bacterium]|mgnify:FL=1|nr:2-amino-4-hydroxy-6-hydroxymethyldihydropteridine diphosphokinase [Burkholderiaceae bacterium]
MRDPVTAYLALGANLGDARATVRSAIDAIAASAGCQLRQRSSLYRTAPIDAGGPDYINAVIAVTTSLSAPDLLHLLQALELQAGRERPYRNAPRTLDLDILLYGDARMCSPQLVLPHPRMNSRAFVLVPLAQIAPQRVSAAQLLAVSDQACVAEAD